MSNVIKILTDAMSAIAAEAIETARQAEAHQKQADEWYRFYQSKDAELSKVKSQLAPLKPGDHITIDGLTLTIKDIKEAGPGGRILIFEEPVSLSPCPAQERKE